MMRAARRASPAHERPDGSALMSKRARTACTVPNPGNVTGERSIYFKSPASLEGEGLNIPMARSELPAAFDDPSTSDDSTSTPEPTPAPSEQPAEQESELAEVPPTDIPPTQPRRSQCLRKPSRIVRDLQGGEGFASNRPADPPLAP